MIIKVIGCGLALLGLSAMVWVQATPAPATASSVSAVTSVATVSPGASFEVGIEINTDVPTRGVNFVLTWDPAKVTCTSADKGNYFTAFADAHGGSVFWSPDSPGIDNDTGRFPKNTSATVITLAAVALMGAQGPDGTFLGVTGQGDVYILHMTANSGASGSVTFSLSNVVLADATADTNDLHPTVNRGTVDISSATPIPSHTPTPAASSTQTPSPTPTPRPTPSSTLTPSPTPTPIASSAPTPSPTPTPIASPAPTASPTTTALGMQTLDLSNAMDASGSLIDEFTGDLPYGNSSRISFHITKGTRAVDIDGKPLTAIELAIPAALPAPPAGGRIIGGFELEPSGATFSMPVSITYHFDFDSALLAQGEDAKNLYMAYFDPEGSRWINCDYTVDLQNHGISANISHLSLYAVIVKNKAGIIGSVNSIRFGWSLVGTIIFVVSSLGILAFYLLVRQRRLPAHEVATPLNYYKAPTTQSAPRLASQSIPEERTKSKESENTIWEDLLRENKTGLGAPKTRLKQERTQTKDSEKTIWDDILQEEESQQVAFKTHLEIVGGKVIIPRDSKSTDIELVIMPNSRILFFMEYDPESKTKGRVRIVVLGSASQYEESDEVRK